MKPTLTKSFWMMKLLNRDYPAPIRAISAALAFGITMVTTGRLVLAREMARRCWVYQDHKIAARRVAWYLRRGWLGLDAVPDDFFDATEGMTDKELTVLESFLAARRSKLGELTYATEHATITARYLNNNTNPNQRSTNIIAFETACNLLLQQDSRQARPRKSDTDARIGDFPIENAKTTLADFAKLFPVTTLPWFVISGTFLGLIREKGFLAHDYDIDLGVFEPDIDIQATIDTVKASDQFVLKKYDHHQSTLFQPKTPATNPDVPYILKLVHATGIHIDLFIHYRDTSSEPAIDWHGSSLHRWENTAFDLAPYDFYDQSVLGPEDADRYLKENYGDWRTPVTQFNCTTDTPNLALVPHPIAIVIFLRRYVLARNLDPVQATKLEEELRSNGFLRKGTGGALSFSGDMFKT